MKVTLKDIAAKSGYSVSTVSRVLSGSEKISTAAKKIIIRAAEELNYPLPNDLHLKVHRSTGMQNVVVVVSGFHVGEFYASYYDGMNQAALKHNVRLFLLSLKHTKKDLFDVIRRLSQQHYDGAILFTPELTHEDYRKLDKFLPSRFPIVSNGLIETPYFHTVTFDGYSGGYQAARHFEQQGYRTAGIIKGPFEKAESRYRYNGFRDYVMQSPTMEFIWECDGDFTYDAGVRALDAFEALDEKPRCVFASSDLMGFAFLISAERSGYSFPDDIALCSYDNLPVTQQNYPTISSIKTDYEQLGHTTISALKEMIEDPKPHKGMLSLIPVSLMERASS